MRLSDKVLLVQSVLNRLYPHPPIPLNHSSPFTLLCAVVLSAQTTDGKVNNATAKLFSLAPTPEAMIQLSQEDIISIIREVGLAPSKSKHLLGLSRMIVEQFHGAIPDSLEGLMRLPGVGRKTASVIMSQVYNVPSFAVDTHVHRLALRWGFTKHQKDPDKVQVDLCGIFPQDDWNRLHLQWIYFGREYCTAKRHVVADCPICSRIHDDGNDIGNRDVNEESSKVFTPAKKAKGIIYYGDRVDELYSSPELTMLSPIDSTRTISGDLSAGRTNKSEPVEQNYVVRTAVEPSLVAKRKRRN